eukprot:3255777-Pleurochrysis_carterae.AAC.1
MHDSQCEQKVSLLGADLSNLEKTTLQCRHAQVGDSERELTSPRAKPPPGAAAESASPPVATGRR